MSLLRGSIAILGALLMAGAVGGVACGGDGAPLSSYSASAQPLAARPAAYVYALGVDNLVMRSADGGAAWTQVHRDALSADLSILWSAAFADPAHGWAVGRASVLATTDRGKHWALQYAGSRKIGLFDVAASDPLHAWAVGRREVKRGGTWTDVAVVLSTSDGVTWHLRTLPQFAWLQGVVFADARHGWAVGEDKRQLYGVVLATDDGGAHWRVQARYEWASLQDVACASTSRVWAVGGPSQYPVSTLHPAPPMILASTDGGAHWEVQVSADEGTDSDLTRVDFVDSEHGWAIGGGGRGVVLATSDGGQTWKTQATGAPKLNGRSLNYNAVSFSDAQHGWIVANHTTLLTTSDGGTTWQPIALPGTARQLTGLCAPGPGGSR
jgi:photosystem II stability/assembly factor-like uncharacterized protein